MIVKYILKACIAIFAIHALCGCSEAESELPVVETAYTLDQFDKAVEALKVADPTESQPMQANVMLLPSRAAPGEPVVMVIKIRLLDGWHFYADVPSDMPFVETNWQATLPSSLKFTDEWFGPEPTDYEGMPGLKVHKSVGKPLVFFREMVVDGAGQSGAVSLSYNYQVCNPYVCQRPTKASFDLEFSMGSVQ